MFYNAYEKQTNEISKKGMNLNSQPKSTNHGRMYCSVPWPKMFYHDTCLKMGDVGTQYDVVK